MKSAKVVHNPKAGEQGLTKKELVDFVKSGGWECRYSSTKDKDWNEIHPETDFIIVAGGDGTVRKAASEILERKMVDKKLPIALLPMGTANNISKTLGIEGELSSIVQSWAEKNIKPFDVGKIEGIDCSFFLESLGAGVFPRLIKDMKAADKTGIENPAEEIKMALQMLYELVLSYEAKDGKINIDGSLHSSKYLMVEIMNTRSVGPNLLIAADADPGDGELDIILVPEEKRNELAIYVLGLIREESPVFPILSLKGKEVDLEWDSTHLHADDQLIKVEKNTKVRIRLESGLLDFLVPANR
ncbi:MAG: NAD(+)/NADH kinase [Chitinophagaceae bacterium]|nr:NAD(+)/NADH kinase [Chitinophagaceae bacterium]